MQVSGSIEIEVMADGHAPSGFLPNGFLASHALARGVTKECLTLQEVEVIAYAYAQREAEGDPEFRGESRRAFVRQWRGWRPLRVVRRLTRWSLRSPSVAMGTV
jgi:hypothetical protein